MTVTLSQVRLETDIPIEGCELHPFVNASRDNGTALGESEIDGQGIEWRWYKMVESKDTAGRGSTEAHPWTSPYRGGRGPKQQTSNDPAEGAAGQIPQHSGFRGGPPTCWLTGEPAALQYVGCPALDIPRFFAAGPEAFIKIWRHFHGKEQVALLKGHKTTSHKSSRSTFNSADAAADAYQVGENGMVELSRTKVFVPSPEDVGHILKLEATLNGKSVSVTTQPVIGLPTPPPRCTIQVEPMRADGSVIPMADQGKFTILTFNVLADLYASRELYHYCPSWSLTWAYRKQSLLREILSYQADILCLQEVQSDHFEDFWQPELGREGYTAVYKKKTGEVFTGTSFAIDGCATFFRRDRFVLVKKYEVEFNKAALSLSEGVPPASKKGALNRLLKDNVALIAVLEALEPPDPDAAAAGKRQLICVANTHIHANPELKDVKLWQVHTLLKGLEKIAASADIPMVVCGDFNSEPGSAAHSLLASGRVDANHPELSTDPLGILRPSTKLCHQVCGPSTRKVSSAALDCHASVLAFVDELGVLFTWARVSSFAYDCRTLVVARMSSETARRYCHS